MEKGLNIPKWAEEDRPREKLLSKGKAALSDAELIAILIGSGSRELSAVDLSQKVLSHSNNDLNTLAKQSVNELQQFKGIGEAKAISIVSALELGRRRKIFESPKKIKISNSKDAYELMKPELMDQPVEQFWVIMLKRNNEVIQKRVIMIHNHPSGNLKASQADIKLTEKLKNAGSLLEIPVLDHIIFTDDGYYSFADENLI